MRGCGAAGTWRARDDRGARRPAARWPERRRAPAHDIGRGQGELARPGSRPGPGSSGSDDGGGHGASRRHGGDRIPRDWRHRRRASRPPGGPVGRPRRARAVASRSVLRRREDRPGPPAHSGAPGEPFRACAGLRMRRVPRVLHAAEWVSGQRARRWTRGNRESPGRSVEDRRARSRGRDPAADRAGRRRGDGTPRVERDTRPFRWPGNAAAPGADG